MEAAEASMEAADAEASALEAAAAAVAAAAAAAVGESVVWPWLGWCWGESTPPAEVASVASEQSAQTLVVALKGDGNIDSTRAK